MTAKEFKGSYAEYTALKAAEKKRAEDALKAAEFAQKVAKTESGHRSKEERAKETKLRLRIKEIETEIGKLEDEETALGNELSTPEVAANFALLTEKCNRLDAVKKRLDELYAEYETLI
jgi:ATP-binding cassette subfamily F protein 3